MGRVKPARGRKRTVRWFFFNINETTAQILFFLALLGLIGTSVGFVFVLIGLLNVLSIYGYYEGLARSQGAEGYLQTSYAGTFTTYIISLVVLTIFLFIELYTIARTAKFRNM